MLHKRALFHLCLSIFSFFDLYIAKPVNENLKLELVQVLFRHGARTPISCEAKLMTFANESFYDPWGYAQLTNQGMMQEYRIGQMLRDRYNDFLPKLYKPEHVYAYASGVSRTKASLELVLAALYPPTDKLAWNNNLNWMAIPIYSNPRPLDILVKSRECPKFIKTVDELLNTPEIKQAAAAHNEILKTMEKIVGRPFGFNNVFCAYNAIFVHKNMNLTLPDWYTDDIYDKLNKASKFHLELLSYTTTLKRLNGGTLVRRFLENINKSNEKLNSRKLYLYSTHDKTLHAFAKSHNLTLPMTPDYGSAIILEKLRDKENKVYVKFSLWIGEPKKLISIKLDKCEEVCPFDKYVKLINPVLPSDEEMLCLLQNLQPKHVEKMLNSDNSIIDD